MEVIKLDIPQGYEFCGVEFDSGKILIRKKQIEYPKTFKECSSVINEKSAFSISGYKGMRLYELQCLLICRDAYWKIAGEEMGLGKPWKPECPSKHYIFTIETNKSQIIFNEIVDTYKNRLLAFPTKEMRNVFYENFKDLIEECKEFL